jgi:hypothetical protein
MSAQVCPTGEGEIPNAALAVARYPAWGGHADDAGRFSGEGIAASAGGVPRLWRVGIDARSAMRHGAGSGLLRVIVDRLSPVTLILADADRIMKSHCLWQ